MVAFEDLDGMVYSWELAKPLLPVVDLVSADEDPEEED